SIGVVVWADAKCPNSTYFQELALGNLTGHGSSLKSEISNLKSEISNFKSVEVTDEAFSPVAQLVAFPLSSSGPLSNFPHARLFPQLDTSAPDSLSIARTRRAARLPGVRKTAIGINRRNSAHLAQ